MCHVPLRLSHLQIALRVSLLPEGFQEDTDRRLSCASRTAVVIRENRRCPCLFATAQGSRSKARRFLRPACRALHLLLNEMWKPGKSFKSCTNMASPFEAAAAAWGTARQCESRTSPHGSRAIIGRAQERSFLRPLRKECSTRASRFARGSFAALCPELSEACLV